MKKNIIMLLTLFAFMVSVVSVHAAPRTILSSRRFHLMGQLQNVAYQWLRIKCQTQLVRPWFFGTDQRLLIVGRPLEPDICCSVIQHRWWKEDAIH